MTRPLISRSIDELQREFERAKSGKDRKALQLLAKELSFRRTPKAQALSREVAAILGQSREGSSAPSHSKSGKRGSPKRIPTDEQSAVIETFSKGNSLRVNAYAGTGKTSTLEMLAHSTSRRGQYLAFNRDIVREAQGRFPKTVDCATTHKLALRNTFSQYNSDRRKLFGRINANQLAEMLSLKPWRVDQSHSLSPRAQGFLILDCIRRFAMSADDQVLARHVSRHGSLRAASEATHQTVANEILGAARYTWARMQNKEDGMPLGHDGYLKMWALSNPLIDTDFILLDEAQDTSPVVLDVLSRQSAQMIYVGDKYQQIYEWRGAVNAMTAIETRDSKFLTTSFRFGPELAIVATKLLHLMGERIPIQGNPAKESRIGILSNPVAVLSRTNASAIKAVMEALEGKRRPHLVGGIDELIKLLKGVADLKNGNPCDVPDFFGFTNWRDVVEFARTDEGEYLQTFVGLVESRGEKQLMWALRQTVDVDKSNIVISTAHKSKGREWSTVRLMDDFLKTTPKKIVRQGTASMTLDPSELRLLYVAFTRAKDIVQVPESLLSVLGIASEQHAPVGKQDAPMSRPKPPQGHAWTPPVDWQPEPQATPAAHKLETPSSETKSEKKKWRWRLFG